ncbi:MAG: response regulator [Desulfamplus sp.]|nr:response regulator [Desulfamplus sp.]
MFLPKISTSPTIEYLMAENLMLREEIKVARDAANITAKLVVKQFEETEKMLRKFQRANSERQAVLDGATQLSIIATDLSGTITLFSPGATTLLGYNKDEMVGKCNISALHLEEEIRLHGEKLFAFANRDIKRDFSSGVGSDSTQLACFDPIEVFDQYVKQKIFESSYWTYIKKDSSLLPINLSITPFYNTRGSLRGYLFTAMDMSSHKIMQRELIEAMKNAEAANASKGDFLARMSHEIRTPMNGVLGMAHLMKKTELSPKQVNYLDKILSSANTLLNLINDILDFSKIDAGKLVIESIDFDLEDVLSHLVNSIGFNAEEKGLEFVFEIDKHVPFNLVGDPLRLGQVLMNLASNAVKFTEHGEIIISVSLDKIKNDDEVTLKFSVQDSGIGLYPEQIEYLFDAFTQADDTITRKYGGTGLGLSICRQLTEMMGGEIWVESNPGKGSNFIFTSKFQLSKSASSHSIAPEELFKGLRALVVDDNETARNVLQSMLESFKMEVDTAQDGSQAIELIDKAVKNGRAYHVVLLDWIMPGIDGIETARRIRANAESAKIPAMLMVTANGREEARVEAEQAGLEAFLLKPVYASVMYDTLIEMLNIEFSPTWLKNNKSDDIKASHAMKGLRGKRILLVEDNSINQEVATEFLKDAGVIVTIASNGLESLNIIDREDSHFDLVLMDIQMPVMDGLEATRKIRCEKNMIDIPIIAMTAHAMAGDRQKSLNAGMNGHISKPVDPIELYNVLSQFIGDKDADAIHADEGLNLNSSFNHLEKRVDIISDFAFKPIQWIDHKTAIKRLNNKPEMFINVLKDFKKDYADEPERLKSLFRDSNFVDIQMRAHTLKGIAGYMGADELLYKSAKLEDFLKLNEMPQNIEVAPLLEELAKSVEQILESLLQIDEIANIDIDNKEIKAQTNNKNVDYKNICVDNSIDKNSITDDELECLNRFMALLHSGYANALDMVEHIETILKKYGYSGELEEILEFINDIDYEAAGKIVKKILANFRGF